MRKLFVKLLLYLFGTLILMFLIIGFFIRIRPQYFLGTKRLDYMRCHYQYAVIKNKSNFKNIIMGDSKGSVDIDPLILGKTWGNLSIEGSNFFEAYISLKQFLKHNKVDTLLMCYDVKADFEGVSSHLNQKTIPFQFISFEELLELEKIERGKGYMLVDAYNFEIDVFGKKIISDDGYLQAKQYLRRLRYLHFPFSYRETFVDGFFNFVLGSYNQKLDDLTVEHMENHLGQFQAGMSESYIGGDMIPDLNKKFNPNLVNLSYLDSILCVTRRNKIFTGIILGPINQETNRQFDHSAYKASFSSFIETSKLRFKNLVFLDSTLIALPDSCFGDRGHTNPRGTFLFSKIVKSKLILKQDSNNKIM